MRLSWKGMGLAVAAGLLGVSPAQADSALVVLSAQDEARYQAAYAAAAKRDWRAMNDALDAVRDRSLEADLDARMLLDPKSRPPAKAFRAWLTQYPDHPRADDIADRAKAKAGVRADAAAIRGRPRRDPLAAPALPGDTAAARGDIAAIVEAFASGDLAHASALAEHAQNGPRAGEARWYLGLIAFHQNDFARAADVFAVSANWPFWDGWGASGAQFWAARAHIAAGRPALALAHLEAAAQWPSTFYGQLAEAQLGRESALNLAAPPLSPEEAAAFIARHPNARRAAALAQLGRLSDVEAELRALHARITRDEDALYLAFAEALEAPAAQLRAAEFGGAEVGAGHCPVTSFAPEDGYQIDRAVLLAVTRQESRFNPTAVSRSNARGLMQLLPSTADDVQRGENFRRAPTKLEDPGLNMRLGQAYIGWLKPRFEPAGDMGKVFAAYNGGPGWLSRWLVESPYADDPLMLLEALPRRESRDYAERVLSHMSLCRKRFGQPTAELDALASGRPAIYQSLEGRQAPLAF